VQVAKATTATAAAGQRQIALELVGHDRPGIIHSIATRLAEHGVSIDKMKTHIASGAMSGEQMFHLDAQLTIPQDLDTDQLQAGLESLANELMVDLSFVGSQGANRPAPAG
jgi:glycine cleavage system regulatory protein